MYQSGGDAAVPSLKARPRWRFVAFTESKISSCSTNPLCAVFTMEVFMVWSLQNGIVSMSAACQHNWNTACVMGNCWVCPWSFGPATGSGRNPVVVGLVPSRRWVLVWGYQTWRCQWRKVRCTCYQREFWYKSVYFRDHSPVFSTSFSRLFSFG